MEDEVRYAEFEKRTVERLFPELEGDPKRLEEFRTTNQDFLDRALATEELSRLRDEMPRNGSSDECRALSYAVINGYLRDRRRLLSHHLRSFDAFLDKTLPETVSNFRPLTMRLDRESYEKRKKAWASSIPASSPPAADRDSTVSSSSSSLDTAAGATTAKKTKKAPKPENEKTFLKFLQSPVLVRVRMKDVRVGSVQRSTPEENEGRSSFKSHDAWKEHEDDVNLVDEALSFNSTYSADATAGFVVETVSTYNDLEMMLEWKRLSLNDARAASTRPPPEGQELSERLEALESKHASGENPSLRIERLTEEEAEAHVRQQMRYDDPDGEEDPRARADAEPRTLFRATRTFADYNIGKHAIMVGSSRCFHGKDERIMPGGYFVVNGIAKILMATEDVAYNRFTVSSVKKGCKKTVRGVSFCRYRPESGAFSLHIVRTDVDEAGESRAPTTSARKGAARVSMTLETAFLKEMPLYQVLGALGCRDEEDVLERVCAYENDPARRTAVRRLAREKMFPEGWKGSSPFQRERCVHAVGKNNQRGGKSAQPPAPKGVVPVAPEQDAEDAMCVQGEGEDRRAAYEVDEDGEEVEVMVLTRKNPRTPAERKREAETRRGAAYLRSYLLPYLGEDNDEGKARTLCFWAHRVLSVALGFTEQDKKSRIENRRVLTADDFLGKMWYAWKTGMDEKVRANVSAIFVGKSEGSVLSDDAEDVFRRIPVIDECLIKHIGTGVFSRDFIGVSLTMDTLSPAAMWSELRKIQMRNKGGKHNGKMLQQRSLEAWSIYFKCPVTTSDGEKIGLQPHFTMLSTTSEGSSPREVIDLLLALRVEPDEGTTTPGWVEGWDPEETRVLSRPRPYAVALRSEKRVEVRIRGCKRSLEDGREVWRSTLPGSEGLVFEPASYRYALVIEGVDPVDPSVYRRVPPLLMKNVVTLAKRAGLLHRHVSVGYDKRHNAVYVATEMGRYVYPVISGDFLRREAEAKRELSMGRWSRLLSRGHVFYVGPLEMQSEDVVVADYLDDFWDRNKRHVGYTVCCVHPSMNYSVVASLVRHINHNGPVRQSYSTQIGKQAIGTHGSMNGMSFASQSMLMYPQRPLVPTVQLGGMRLDEKPQVNNFFFMKGHYEGYGIEDPFIVSKRIHDMELMTSARIKCVSVEESRNPTSKRHVIFRKPYRFKARHVNPPVHITEKGPPLLNSYIEKGELLCARVSLPAKVPSSFFSRSGSSSSSSVGGSHRRGQRGRDLDSLSEEETNRLLRDVELASDASVTMTEFDRAQVIGLHFYTRIVLGARIRGVKIVLKKIDEIEAGDKGGIPEPQKGVCSLVLDPENMPFDSVTKEVVELIINPFNFTRNTEGQQVQDMATEQSLIQRGVVDGTAFESEDPFVRFKEFFEARGVHYSGRRTLCSGITGKRFEAEVYVATIDYYRLRHLVSSKLNVGASGPVNSQTHESVRGQSLRFGEMERDCLLGHGSAEIGNAMRAGKMRTALPVCPICSNSETVIPRQPQDTTRDKDYTIKDYWCSYCEKNVKPSTIHMPYAAHITLQDITSSMTVCEKKVA